MKSPHRTICCALIGSISLSLSGCSEPTEDAPQIPEEKRVSVRAASAEYSTIQSWVFAEGTARSKAREYLVFQEAGRITYIQPGLREGSLVTKGAVLARQDQRRIDADLHEAKTQATLAQKTFLRFAALVKQESASQQEYDEAKAQVDQANATLDKIQVRIEESKLVAPIDGMVAYLNIEEGYYFQPSIVRTDSEEAALNTVPIIVIDPSNFKIAVDIPVYDRDRVKTGQPVLIQSRYSQQEGAQDQYDARNAQLENRAGQTPPENLESIGHIGGEVYSVNPAVSPSGRSIQVEIHTVDESLSLKDGMYVTAWVATERRENVLVAPLDAFIFRDNEPYVFVIDEIEQTAVMRRVVLGLQGFDAREVLSGIAANERMVTDGRYQLSTGTKLKVLGDSTPRQTSRKDAGAERE